MRFLIVLGVYFSGTLLSFYLFPFAASLYLWSNIFRPLQFAHRPDSLPVAKYVIFILFFSYILNMIKRNFSPKWNIFIFFNICMLLWIYIAAENSPFRPVSIGHLMTLLKYIIPILFISSGLRSERDVKIVLATLVFSIGIWGAQGGFYSILHGVTIDMGIPGGLLEERNYLSAVMLSITPLMIYFLMNYNWKYKFWVRLLIGFMTITNIAGVFLSNSRGATIGVGGVIVSYILMLSKNRVRDFIVLFVFVGIILIFLPKEYYDRVKTIRFSKTQTESSAQDRFELAQAAVWVTMENPVFGIGPGCWLLREKKFTFIPHYQHSIWLVLSTEYGVPGLLMYLFIIFYTFKRIYNVRNISLKINDKDSYYLSSCLILSLIGVLICYSFLNHPFGEYLWTLVACSNTYYVLFHEKLYAQYAENVEDS